MNPHRLLTATRFAVCCVILTLASQPITLGQTQKGPGGQRPPSQAPMLKLLQRPLDPFGTPRPAPATTGIPRRTSLYFELVLDHPQPGDAISTPTLAIVLKPEGGKPIDVLRPGARFARGFSGWIKPQVDFNKAPSLGIYIEPARPLDALTTYTMQVTASSLQGVRIAPGDKLDRWTFTTAASPRRQTLAMDLDLSSPSVHWQGHFFSGFVKCDFSDSACGLEPSYAMMARDREKYPRAWVHKRDFWLTGMDHTLNIWHPGHPNIVRELETRRVAAITPTDGGWLLQVEDFFGHEQYCPPRGGAGIPANRPLREDYRPGYEILIADGTKHVRARVLAVDDAARSVLVSRFEMPEGGFTIDDPAKYPRQPDPVTPGLFPKGGCYLRRFAPAGTPRYYWGRLDQEWDLSRRYGQRIHVNFTDAPGDLSNQGQNWCPPKDYAELHQVVGDITSHVIERYGPEAALSYTWSIFNEPDLGGLFWRGSKAELNKFYDYTVDAILRAFEDHGLDSEQVFIGGLELGAISPNLPRLEEFLRHCSPDEPTTVALNAAWADPRLDGRHSRRVEALCRTHNGKGTPIDFISIHAYDSSATAASKFKRAKDIALAVNPAYYEKLWICSHEATPSWMPRLDTAWRDVYLGNGYYPVWCADIVWHQLREGARDPRYAMGNSILTYWPWPAGFGPSISATQTVAVDDDGDGKADRQPTIPTPIYNFLNLLGSPGEDYWVLPEQTMAGQKIAGFASRGPKNELRVLLFAQDPADLQARGGQEFKIKLTVNPGGRAKGANPLRAESANPVRPEGANPARAEVVNPIHAEGANPVRIEGANPVKVLQYQFDRHHHTYYERAQKLLTRGNTPLLSAREFQKLENQLALKPNNSRTLRPNPGGLLPVTADLVGNGVTFLVIEDVPSPKGE